MKEQEEKQEASTTLDNYFTEINIPKEEMPEPPEEIIKPEPPQETLEEQNAKKLQADFTSRIITQLLNSGLSFSASLYSITGSPEDFSASQKDLKDIEEQIFEMLKNKGWNLPPRLALSLSISFAYLPVLQKAHKIRKEAINSQADEPKEQIIDVENHDVINSVIELRKKEKTYFEIVNETGLKYWQVQKIVTKYYE